MNDYSEMTMTDFMAKSNLIPNAFKWEKLEIVIFLTPKSLYFLKEMISIMRLWFYLSSKCQTDLCPFIQGHSFGLPHSYLNIFPQKSLGCLNSNFKWNILLFVLGHLIKIAATSIYGKTKYVLMIKLS